MEAFDGARLLNTLRAAGHLKRLLRTGWVERGIPAPESVADHSFRVILMAALLAPPDLDRQTILEMAVLHDLAEAHVGDITPQSPEYAEKPAREYEALNLLLEPVREKARLVELWAEFERGQTPEARFVRELDRLEAALQSLEYREKYPDTPDLQVFISNAEQSIEHPLLKLILAELKECNQPVV